MKLRRRAEALATHGAIVVTCFDPHRHGEAPRLQLKAIASPPAMVTTLAPTPWQNIAASSLPSARASASGASTS
jgi:hypothetical protein